MNYFHSIKTALVTRAVFFLHGNPSHVLTLSSSQLPSSTSTSTSGGVLVSSVGTAPGGGMLASYSTGTNSLADTIPLTVPNYSGNTFTITLPEPDAVGAIESIRINGVVYDLATESGQSQTFIWNPDTGEITITIPESDPPQENDSVVVNRLLSERPSSLTTNEVAEAHPAFFSEWNIEGEFQRSRDFEGQPSASLSFTTLATNEADVRSQLKVGTKLVLYGEGYTIQSIQINRLSRKAYHGRWIQVSVSLTGYWAEEIEGAIKARISGCDVSLSEYADRAGVDFSGPTVELNLPPDTPGSATTTFRQEVESRARSVKSFVYYGNRVELRRWGETRLHTISTADVTTPIQISIGGTGAEYEDIRLAFEFRNTKWEPDRKWAGQRQSRDYDVWVEDEDENFDLPPEDFLSGRRTLRTGGDCFDNGGETKERTATLYRNGVVRRVIKTKKGFVYTTDQTYVTSGNPTSGYRAYYAYIPVSAFWDTIESSTEDYTYNSEGYLVSVRISGWKLARYKQEQGTETINLRLQLLAGSNPVAQGQLNLYQNWFNFAFSDTTTYTLEEMRGRYPDIKKPRDDETWIEPKYAQRTVRKTEEQIFTPNPRSTPQRELPPIVTGKRFKETKRIIINYPPRGIPEQDWVKEFEQYTVKTITESAEGENFRNSTRRRHRSEQLGRPGIQQRSDDPSNDRDPCVPSANLPQPQISTRYLLNTPDTGLTVDDPEEGSISFPGIYDSETGKECAEVVASISNTRDAERWSFTVSYQAGKDIEEGDRISLLGRVLIVFGLSESRQIVGSGLVSSGGIQIEAGRYLVPDVELTEDAE